MISFIYNDNKIENGNRNDSDDERDNNDDSYIMKRIISLLSLLIVVVKCFLAYDELGMCMVSLVCPEQPGWQDCKRTVAVSDMTVVLAGCLGHPSHALIDPALLSFPFSDSYISAMKSPRPRVVFWEIIDF